jgi:glycosyltransferase involved in cell wall biosynthesis
LKVAIAHQGFIPHYRLRFFEELSVKGAHDYVVIHGAPPSGSGHYAAEGPFLFPNVSVRTHELSLAGKSLIYQPMLRRVLRDRFDAIVLGTHVRFLSNHLILAAFKLVGRPVFYWGHARESPTGDSRLARSMSLVASQIKDRTTRIADGYLAYTKGGADRLIGAGFDPKHVIAVGNTLDVETQISLYDEMKQHTEPELRKELGLARDSVILLFVGRIYAEKRLDELIDAVRRLTTDDSLPPVELVVIGDGPDAQRVREIHPEMAFVHFTGELRDQARIARYLRIASAVVIPGALGLAVNHALAHGVPIISRASGPHGPEIEYLTPGRDSFIVEGDLDAFVDVLGAFIASPALRANMAQASLAARNQLRLDAMVRSFDCGVSTLLAAVGRVPKPR